jgi:membrane protease YdiL (CAAX protease family)
LSDRPGLLPNTAVERAAFVLLSLTAGVCKEVLYRGFLIRFLHESVLALPMAGALAASALIFGLGHC